MILDPHKSLLCLFHCLLYLKSDHSKTTLHGHMVHGELRWPMCWVLVSILFAATVIL